VYVTVEVERPAHRRVRRLVSGIGSLWERPARSRRRPEYPLVWIWIASKLAGNKRELTPSLAVFIATGIIVSYWLALLVGSWIRGRTVDPGEERARMTRRSWNRSFSDAPRPEDQRIDPIERVFIVVGVLAPGEGEAMAPRRRSKPRCVFTPHPGEMKRLGKHFGQEEIADGDDARISLALAAAKAFGQVIILKGARTVVTDGNRVYVEPGGDIVFGQGRHGRCSGRDHGDAVGAKCPTPSWPQPSPSTCTCKRESRLEKIWGHARCWPMM